MSNTNPESEAGPSTIRATELPKRKRFRVAKKNKQDFLTNNFIVNSTSIELETESNEWPYLNLNDNSSTSAVNTVLSPDSSYCFISSGDVVKIYSVLSAELLSTLSISPNIGTTPFTKPGKITCLLLNPANLLQLVTGSTDGMLRVWNYQEGVLIRTIDLGSPIQYACGNQSLPDQIFVALIDKNSTDSPPPAGIYSVSLKPGLLPSSVQNITSSTPRTTSRRMRLAQPRIIRSLQISPSGKHLLSLTPTTINICATSNLSSGFSTSLQSSHRLTCLAFHPSEDYFATGCENGSITLWYGVLEEEKNLNLLNEVVDSEKEAPSTPVSTSTLHWHALSVSSLCFTPNGAYLISGGSEAVLVLWQLHSNHREYVPRLGAPIVSIAVTTGFKTEPEVIVRLRDGSVVFISSQKLTISKIISGLKTDPAQHSQSLASSKSSRQPLAVQSSTQTLALAAGHPSSIQFYSTSDAVESFEIEISPSNRTSSALSIEPTRVEVVAFSSPTLSGKNAGSYWMATLDHWENPSFSSVYQLKFWSCCNNSSFKLTTRIDRPHDSTINSMEFSPSIERPCLLTTSSDKTVKIWDFIQDSWHCRASISYRSFIPIDAAWSTDSSMFVVAYARSIVLWSSISGTLIHAFPSEHISPIVSVEFAGKEGDSILAVGQNGMIVWDLLNFEEIFNSNFGAQNITVKPSSSVFYASESAGEAKVDQSDILAIDYLSPINVYQSRTLPFLVQQSIWLKSSTSSSPSEVAMAMITTAGEVVLVGETIVKSTINYVPPTPLPAIKEGQSRLFDAIFGDDPPVVQSLLPSTNPTTAESSVIQILNAPAHALPPAKLLWRSLLNSFIDVSADIINEDLDLFKNFVSVEGIEKSKQSLEILYSDSPDVLIEIFTAQASIS